MGKKDKLIERLKSKPKDFTFAETASLLEYQVKELIRTLDEEGLL